MTRSPAAWRSPGPPRRRSGATTSSEPVRLRMGADEEPGRRAPVEAEEWRGRRHGAGCPRQVEAHRAVHADHGPLPAVRPGLREDLAALPGESGPVRGRVRPGLVQADAPGHGAARALPRPGGAGRRAHLAGPDPRGQSQADRREGHRRAQGQDPGVGPFGLAAGVDRLGVGVDLPGLRQARRCERRAHSPRAAEGLGRQPAGPAGEGAQDARGHPERVQQARSPAARRSRSPT